MIRHSRVISISVPCHIEWYRFTSISVSLPRQHLLCGAEVSSLVLSSLARLGLDGTIASKESVTESGTEGGTEDGTGDGAEDHGALPAQISAQSIPHDDVATVSCIGASVEFSYHVQ